MVNVVLLQRQLRGMWLTWVCSFRWQSNTKCVVITDWHLFFYLIRNQHVQTANMILVLQHIHASQTFFFLW